MAEFNSFDSLAEVLTTDDFLVVRDGVGYKAEVSQLPVPTASIQQSCFQIRKPSGQSGGNFYPPNTWIVRPFNHANSVNQFGVIAVSPTAGALELPSGRYQVNGWLTGMEGAGMRCRLRSLNATGIEVYGASTYSKHYSWHIPLQGLFAIAQTTQFVAEMRCDRDRNKSWGFGYRTHIEPEIYGSLIFVRY